MNDVTDGIVSLVEGGFEFAFRACSGVGLVMKEAVGEGSAELFVEEHEQEGDFGSFVGEPVGVTLAVAFNQAVRFHLAQIVTELIQPIAVGGDGESSEDGAADIFGSPAAHGCTAVQEDLHQADHPGVVDFNTGELRRGNGNG